MLERRIREARQNDFQFVSDIMDAALAPYYDGDHRAHASRIFWTHISGGKDSVGHFSEEQKMFIIEEGNTRIGIINVVGKRQGTWKISPLIIANDFQGKAGCGSELLAFAERYIRERGARQAYCTVAEQNRSALAFFYRKGYVYAGRSVSHYKPGVTEIMLYKLFYSNEDEERIDRASISVVPFEERYREGVYRVILNSDLPKYFRGVDRSWVDALFTGYERRDTGEVNQKYKLIYVAVDRAGEVLGVAGVTPKKGQPIKIMPCAASNPQAFAALIADLPQHLRQFGRKLYTHIVPSVEETVVLQRMGWSLDAMMPGAYHENYCTQQWGNNMEDNTMRTLRVKNRFFNEIMSRRKTLEVRVAYANIKSIRVGENIQLLTGANSGIVRVRAVRTYTTFELMLSAEDSSKVLPGMDKPEALSLLRGIYPADKERLGVVVLDIEPVR
ncbi:MAG: hypothetical protein A2534_03845 [Candidatus Magasanikbacteria bacterium RIFOXYD2_FULL_39_9]|uniref:N-acetyltransferase domain-containing protein n=1 Tax=Candidatus Magasanikbacteria bacterium RIFOXYD1_FULL_40_23 TaxID=1798705 RepID=A0A1F6PAH3_9BACT|nr:MAG: hypothetical protein A2534_03845 [Candidatus Magasanikbacteria bacterium RIFOXYD2_FULL_39_9]OGH93177.1 MAG: hypothetical protein A2563_01060 [Candidatus Magasanikbacteria bacterium RIFOXYD1_FULL_40_23]